MVQKKKQSKRVTLRQKHKIERKVREHNRKARREAKKNPNAGLNKSKKDPGIPNLYPFKQELLQKMENQKAKLEEEKDRQRVARMKEQQKKREESKKQTKNIQSLAADALSRDKEFEKKERKKKDIDVKASIYNLRDTSKKQFYREFKKIVERADVILEVLDARDPLGCRCPDVEQKILQKDPNKKIILVLNKIDLIPRDNCEAWLKYLRNEFPTIAFKCSTQDQRKHLGRSNMSTDMASKNMLESSECLGADTLVQLLKNYCRNVNIKTGISVGIIGYPNVGKSSLINSLKRARAVGVGATPGFTKTVQEVSLDKNIKLLDCPGIVFGGASGSADNDIVLRNCVKVEHIPDPIEPVESILKRCRSEQLLEHYQIAKYATVTEFLLQVAQKKGKLKKGGAADLEAAARSVLQDWNGGKIDFYTVPPQLKNVHVAAAIVSQWSKEFDLDSIVKQEQNSVLANIQNDKASNAMAMEPGSASANMEMFEEGMDDVDDEEEDDDDEDSEEEDEDEDEEGSDGQMEDEEDGEEEQEEEDMEDVDVPQVSGKKNGKAPLNTAQRQKKVMTDEEDKVNPQLNQLLKKKQKQIKKQEKKKNKLIAEVTMHDDEDRDNMNDNYDFAEFLGAKKGGLFTTKLRDSNVLTKQKLQKKNTNNNNNNNFEDDDDDIGLDDIDEE